MDPIDKRAYKFGVVAAVVAVIAPLLVQAVLTAGSVAANIA